MKFSIYYEQNGLFHEFYKINRTSTGLYFNPVYHHFRSVGFDVPKSSLSYHEDGKSWTKVGNKKDTKWQRVPLSKIDAPLTLSKLQTALISSESGRPRTEINLSEEDVVFKGNGSIGIEIILSKQVPVMDDKDERLNSKIYTKDTNPKMIIEIYNTINNTLTFERFPSYGEPSVLGKNFFTDGDGRI